MITHKICFLAQPTSPPRTLPLFPTYDLYEELLKVGLRSLSYFTYYFYNLVMLNYASILISPKNYALRLLLSSLILPYSTPFPFPYPPLLQICASGLNCAYDENVKFIFHAQSRTYIFIHSAIRILWILSCIHGLTSLH